MPSLFIARHSSRHRTACFALYKALIQQGLKVPLPDNVLRPPGLEGPVHPIKHLIRASFHRNQNDTSPRLVISALRNGYKFLDLLTEAQSTSSQAYHEIHTFLSDRIARKRRAISLRAQHPPRPPPPTSAPNTSTIPLLTLVSPPDQPPVYKPTRRPLPVSELGGSGIRRVPVLEKANFLPFLRVTKPQPPLVSRVIRQKIVRMGKVVGELQSLVDEGLSTAAEEDEWEDILEREGLVGKMDLRERQRGKASFSASVRHDIYETKRRLLGLRLDEYARGVALQELVVKERELAERETRERKERKRRERREGRRRRGGGDGGERDGGRDVPVGKHEVEDAIRGTRSE